MQKAKVGRPITYTAKLYNNAPPNSQLWLSVGTMNLLDNPSSVCVKVHSIDHIEVEASAKKCLKVTLQGYLSCTRLVNELNLAKGIYWYDAWYDAVLSNGAGTGVPTVVLTRKRKDNS